MPGTRIITTSLSLDSAVYSAGESAALEARLIVRNTTGDTVSLSFGSSQVYDLEIRNEKGAVVYRWSAGKSFAQVITDFDLVEEREFAISASLKDLPAGKYVAQAWLVAIGLERAYSASVGFEIISASTG
jgi:hypothetical protein